MQRKALPVIPDSPDLCKQVFWVKHTMEPRHSLTHQQQQQQPDRDRRGVRMEGIPKRCSARMREDGSQMSQPQNKQPPRILPGQRGEADCHVFEDGEPSGTFSSKRELLETKELKEIEPSPNDS
ncbi:hypothetical protein EYF80_006549 [Liparis tanakae]|uniref:Uncharacterized protein n=1 Tax=Liparis tanakae TaxID=230148 RepID=A0A4Z2IZA3_9TELE|nr:hypothetical protein EYF80_006549 [Liparis tanakae]